MLCFSSLGQEASAFSWTSLLSRTCVSPFRVSLFYLSIKHMMQAFPFFFCFKIFSGKRHLWYERISCEFPRAIWQKKGRIHFQTMTQYNFNFTPHTVSLNTPPGQGAETKKHTFFLRLLCPSSPHPLYIHWLQQDSNCKLQAADSVKAEYHSVHVKFRGCWRTLQGRGAQRQREKREAMAGWRSDLKA